MSPRVPLALPSALLRQIARSRPAARSRHAQPPIPHHSACFTTSTCLGEPKRPLPLKSSPSSSAPIAGPTLSALAARLSLRPAPDLHPALIACLTHPSFARSPSSDSGEPSSTPSGDIETNELLSSLGNSLLGLFASEHLASLYPYLPTEALKSGVTAYVGPAACFSVARELGVGVQGTGTPGPSHQDGRRRIGTGHGGRPLSEGVPVRWAREAAFQKVPVARRFRGRMEREEGIKYGEHENQVQRKEGWEEVVAGVVRAFVGLVYQEQGMAAARQFTHAHFLSRYLNMTSLFRFNNPKHILSRVVAKHLADAGVSEAEGQGGIESRLLASTGTNSQSPLFNIGLFLTSGLKLSEGHGSSLKMAEHRAAINALHSVFLVRSDSGGPGEGLGLPGGAGVAAAAGAGPGPGGRQGGFGASGTSGQRAQLPTEAHGQWAVEGGQVGRGVDFQGGSWGGGKEVLVESGSRK